MADSPNVPSSGSEGPKHNLHRKFAEWYARVGWAGLMLAALAFEEAHEFGVAEGLLFAGALSLVYSTFYWRGIKEWPRLTITGRILGVVFAICLLVVGCIWILGRKGSDPWSQVPQFFHGLLNKPTSPQQAGKEGRLQVGGPEQGQQEIPAPPQPSTQPPNQPRKTSRPPTEAHPTPPALPAASPIPSSAPPSDPLLDRAIAAIRSCNSFEHDAEVKLRQAQADIQRHNAQPHETEENNLRYAAWRVGIDSTAEMTLYQQVYKTEFVEVRRLLILSGSRPGGFEIDYENPGNMGAVGGICLNLSETTEDYLNRQYALGKIDKEDGQRYFKSLREAQSVPQQ